MVQGLIGDLLGTLAFFAQHAHTAAQALIFGPQGQNGALTGAPSIFELIDTGLLSQALGYAALGQLAAGHGPPLNWSPLGRRGQVQRRGQNSGSDPKFPAPLAFGKKSSLQIEGFDAREFSV